MPGIFDLLAFGGFRVPAWPPGRAVLDAGHARFPVFLAVLGSQGTVLRSDFGVGFCVHFVHIWGFTKMG